MARFTVVTQGQHHIVIADHYKVQDGFVEFFSSYYDRDGVAIFAINSSLSIIKGEAQPVEPIVEDIPF